MINSSIEHYAGKVNFWNRERQTCLIAKSTSPRLVASCQRENNCITSGYKPDKPPGYELYLFSFRQYKSGAVILFTLLSTLTMTIFLSNSEAFKRYFLTSYETEGKKKAGKYEEHKRRCRRQGRKREVRF